MTNQARQAKGSALNDLDLDLIEEQAWNQIVNNILIEQELRRRGITVTDQDVIAAARDFPPPPFFNDPLFQTGGQFDYNKYLQFMSNLDGLQLRQFEEYYRSILPEIRLRQQIASGIYVPDSELWAIYRDRTERIEFNFVALDPEITVDDGEVSVTEKDLRSYYDENLEDFRQPATADVYVVTLSRVPSPADSAAAQQRAEGIRQQLLDGADFAELATANSADRGSAELGGDLGWFGRNQMTPEFETAAFALEPGAISELVQTQYGYHVIKVAEKEEDRVQASHILIPIVLQGDSEDAFLSSADFIEDLSPDIGLVAAADSVGIGYAQITLSAESDFVTGLGSFGPAIFWAFHDSIAEGDVSRLYEVEDGFYVFELVERRPESYLAFVEAEPSLRRRVTLQKKKETVGWLADQVVGQITGGASLEQIAAEHGLFVQTSGMITRLDFVPGLGQANDVIGTAFGLEPNEIAGPIESDDRLYFIQVIDRSEADHTTFELSKEDMRAQLGFQRQQSALDEWLAALREDAAIEDWRSEFFIPRA
jgi:peptidyl-prolyl cis-trans isomerase D